MWGDSNIPMRVLIISRRAEGLGREILKRSPVCLSICLSVCLSVCLSIWFSHCNSKMHNYFLETLQVCAPCHGGVLYSFWYWWDMKFFVNKNCIYFFPHFMFSSSFYAICNIFGRTKISGGGGGGANLKKKSFSNLFYTFLFSHCMFSSHFMLFPTFLGQVFFRI